MTETYNIWVIILGLGAGSFFLRFIFMGVIGDRPIPEWVLRHLRYTAVGFLPAIASPLVLMPAATEGQLDPARLAAALVTLGIGYFTKNVVWAILSGAITLYGLLFLLG